VGEPEAQGDDEGLNDPEPLEDTDPDTQRDTVPDEENDTEPDPVKEPLCVADTEDVRQPEAVTLTVGDVEDVRQPEGEPEGEDEADGQKDPVPLSDGLGETLRDIVPVGDIDEQVDTDGEALTEKDRAVVLLSVGEPEAQGDDEGLNDPEPLEDTDPDTQRDTVPDEENDTEPDPVKEPLCVADTEDVRQPEALTLIVGDVEEERHSVGEPDGEDDTDEQADPEPLEDVDGEGLREMVPEDDTDTDAEKV
jgi:hypothetical protein